MTLSLMACLGFQVVPGHHRLRAEDRASTLRHPLAHVHQLRRGHLQRLQPDQRRVSLPAAVVAGVHKVRSGKPALNVSITSIEANITCLPRPVPCYRAL